MDELVSSGESMRGQLAFIADLSVVTVAALVPENFEVRIVDERVDDLDLDMADDIIMITGKFSQESRMKQLAQIFSEKGKIVILGGVFATLHSDYFADCYSILVQGEFEGVAKQVFEDIEKGEYKSIYKAPRVPLKESPVPAWDLYPSEKSMIGGIQFSRGCPRRCDFCDIIRFFEGTVRFKENEQIITELNLLSKHFSFAFFVDDNFFASRKKGISLLKEIIKWQQERPADQRMAFVTQVTMSVLADEELLSLLDQANFRALYIGLESINPANYAIVNKSHNANLDLDQCFDNLYKYDMIPFVGLIFGFDNDTKETFQETIDFVEKHCFTMMHINTLVAPEGSPLYTNLKKEGRIDTDSRVSFGQIYDTNVIPKNMSKQELLDGVYDFVEKVYDSEAFGKRAMRLAGKLNDLSKFTHIKTTNKTANLRIAAHLYDLGRRYEKTNKGFIKKFWDTALKSRKKRGFLLSSLLFWRHIIYNIRSSGH
jgi:radical SAM superfamily enzyme YgiQ (UPF0313 family)